MGLALDNAAVRVGLLGEMNAALGGSYDFASAAFGISGLETALAVALVLVHEGRLDLTALVARLTAGLSKRELLTG